MIFNSVLAAIGQMDDRRFQRVLLLGVGLSLGALILATIVVAGLIGWLVGPTVTLPWIGEVHWIGNVASISSVLLMMVLSVVLMVPIASAITSLFLDQVADAVEERHYPHLPPATEVPLWDGIRDGLRMLAVTVVANLLALILYLVFAPLAPVIFWLLNGFLLGREYFMLAAMRRVGRPAALKLRRKYIGIVWATGTVMAIPLTIPVVNLLIPVLGAAAFTHLYHGLTGAGSSGRTNPGPAR
ncbi:EI24 domain-containing protein [Chachezhania sediminis]|uniref:EI24 domain-containing protein n=1 Tax=Chachezhania sediminis TaxID=2599291 RepID=UPI00131B375C|nr:EI24 domain-containing protein [Chachezhania sediminis]